MRVKILICLVAEAFITIQSCQEPSDKEWFVDLESMSIYDYMVLNESQFSSFLKILEADSLDMTLSAYNPKGSGYTVFLPTNQAINHYINNSSNYSSLNDLLSDRQDVSEFARYHVVPECILTSDFPFGALHIYNLSGERLVVNFIIGTDSAYYKINNQVPIIKKDIELTNGCIHILGGILLPITYTNYDWLAQDPGLSIFKSLIDTTGLDEVIDINVEGDGGYSYQSTLLVEPDSVYHKFNIFSLEDLIAEINPEYNDYTNEWNPLYYYAAYHILEGTWFLNDFVDNHLYDYGTLTGERILISGAGNEIKINPGEEILDTIFEQGDTIIIDYVDFLYDESNVVTQNGAAHFINRILKTDLPHGEPARQSHSFQFYEELLIWDYSREEGEYLIEDTSLLDVITWSGTDLYYVKSNYRECPAWNEDFLLLHGDFYISYSLPEIDTGKFIMYLGAEANSEANAMIEVYLDGNNIGGTIDLRSSGNQRNPFLQIDLGVVSILSNEGHLVEIESSVPGRFIWDYILFEPI
jgi:uncharacterized surface protein with fasciclin (FAS1) repeats